MILTLTRDHFTPTTTLGRLSIIYDGGLRWSGKEWVAHTSLNPLPFGYVCEDEDRGLHQEMSAEETARVKVPRETAIGVGEYDTIIRWSPKHRREVIELVGVVGFRYVQVHAGNTEAQTDACLLPGLSRDLVAGRVGRSRLAEDWLIARARDCRARNEKVQVWIGREAGAWGVFNSGRLAG